VDYENADISRFHAMHETYRLPALVLAVWIYIAFWEDENEQDWQGTYYNVTFRRIRATTVAAEKQEVLHIPTMCVCGIMYLA
jgi:hypothetical protein